MAQKTYIEVGFPFQLDGRGRVADPSYDTHVEQMIELVLFTSPGERVNRPTFGCGLLELLFDVNDAQLPGGLEVLVQTALNRWLGNVITVERVDVTPKESTVMLAITYSLLNQENRRVATFEPPKLPWQS